MSYRYHKIYADIYEWYDHAIQMTTTIVHNKMNTQEVSVYINAELGTHFNEDEIVDVLQSLLFLIECFQKEKRQF